MSRHASGRRSSGAEAAVSGPRSLWIESTPETSYAALAGGVDVDVVGGGIAGITTAFLLKRAGKSVAVVEANRILHGATGYTTAKVTAAHSLTCTTVAKNFGEEGARLDVEANEAALERVARLADELNAVPQSGQRSPRAVASQLSPPSPLSSG